MINQLRYYAQMMQSFELMETWEKNDLNPSWIHSLLLGEIEKINNFHLQKLHYRINNKKVIHIEKQYIENR